MQSIAMFNNKGGVGKTTLTCNLASFLSAELKMKVLVVDCDPQCNSTQLILGVEPAADLYMTPQTDFTTVSDILSPIDLGESSIRTDISVVPADQNRFNVDLIAGNPDFAITEDRLADAWKDLTARDVQGFRRTAWNAALRDVVERFEYDFVFYDLGPSLGSINRSVLVGCDNFLTPLSSDIFSIIGIRNISKWLTKWLDDYNHAWDALPEAQRDSWLQSYPHIGPPRISSGYVGYIVQQYITKSYSGTRRATKAYENIMEEVPAQINESLSDFTPGPLKQDPSVLNLGDIPHLYSLVPLAQKNAVPIGLLTAKDGLVGSQYRQQESFREMISKVANALVRNLRLIEEGE